jgi:hypothetical protein
MDSQCPGTTFPSCSPTTHTCVCRRPSSSNKLVNPGFDGSGTAAFTGWHNLTGTPIVDSEGCPGSNAVFLENMEDDPSQCIPLTPGDYFVGGKFKGGQSGNFIRVHFRDAANCLGNLIGSFDLFLSPQTDWTQVFSDMPAPAGTVSAEIGVWALNLNFDQLFLGTSNQF